MNEYSLEEQTQRRGDDGSETMTYERSQKELMHVDLGGESREEAYQLQQNTWRTLWERKDLFCSIWTSGWKFQRQA